MTHGNCAVHEIILFIGTVFISAITDTPPSYSWWFITTTLTIPLGHCSLVVYTHRLGGHKPPVCLPPAQMLMWWNISTTLVDIHHQRFYSVYKAKSCMTTLLKMYNHVWRVILTLCTCAFSTVLMHCSSAAIKDVINSYCSPAGL